MSMTHISGLKDNENLFKTFKEKMLDVCSYIRLNNNKIGSKALEDTLAKKLKITK